MILEYTLKYKSSSMVYETLFLLALQEKGLKGEILKENHLLKLYVKADSLTVLEDFSEYFSKRLPHSIFLYSSEASLVETMPTNFYKLINHQNKAHSFCPSCLEKVMDERSENYYDIFTSCSACGYKVKGKHKSYEDEISELANEIRAGKTVLLNTFYGQYYVGDAHQVEKGVDFDLIAYDLVTIENYTTAKTHDITALGSFEKPLIKLNTKLSFKTEHENIDKEVIRFKLPDDFILHLLMQKLSQQGIKLIFITQDTIAHHYECKLVECKEEFEPIEVVTSAQNIAIVSGEKGLPNFEVNTQKVSPAIGAFDSVLKENNLKDEHIVGIYLSKKHQNSILIQGKKYGIVQYLPLTFNFSSIANIFEQIQQSNTSGEKIVQNYTNKFPKLVEKISTITVKEQNFNIFALWGIIAIILGYSKTSNLIDAAHILEEQALTFLGTKGPRIDYKLIKEKKTIRLDALMTIRTAMSFRLAGVDPLTLSYGVIESFTEFLENELDEIKQNMNTTAVVFSGSLLGNPDLFNKINKEISINHNIYFNNELCIDESNIFCG